jgi:hypothetical protein
VADWPRRWRRRRGAGDIELYVADPFYDDWSVVADYDDISTAKAFCQRLREAGYSAVITSDWPLDEFGRGDIALRVPPEDAIAAQEWLDEPMEQDVEDLFPDVFGDQ